MLWILCWFLMTLTMLLNVFRMFSQLACSQYSWTIFCDMFYELLRIASCEIFSCYISWNIFMLPSVENVWNIFLLSSVDMLFKLRNIEWKLFWWHMWWPWQCNTGLGEGGLIANMFIVVMTSYKMNRHMFIIFLLMTNNLLLTQYALNIMLVPNDIDNVA